MSTDRTNARSTVLDLMKGFAMLMTVFCHAQQRAMGNECANTVIWQLVHWWHMPLFFIVSGVLAANKVEETGNVTFVKDKAIRLLWPWFIWRWLEWLFMRFKFSGLLPFNGYVPKSFWGNLKAFIQMPFRPMWFLFDLFLFFVLLHVIVKAGKAGWNGWIIVLAAIASGASIIFFYVCIECGVSGYDKWTFLYYDAQYLGLFLYGFIYGLFIKGSDKKWYYTATIIGLCASAMICISHFGIDPHFEIIRFWLRAVIFTSLIGICCVQFSRLPWRPFRLVGKGLVFMGRNSMEFYTIQFLFLDIGYMISNTALRWTVNFIGCMLGCTLLIKIVKPYPIVRRLLWGTRH